jgi:NTP pyrophosphatase (non-canonical NTP hydrolase)
MDNFEQLQANVYQWANEKGLIFEDNSLAQYAKVNEEVGEVGSAILKGDRLALKDGIGDSLVTLIILAYQNDMHPVDCLNEAWKEIKDRKGKTVDGTFIKD